MNTYLFIGGSRDGHHIAIPFEHAVLQVPKPLKLNVNFIHPLLQNDANSVAIGFETYHLNTLANSNDEPIKFYVSSSLSTKEAFARLFLFYKPPTKP